MNIKRFTRLTTMLLGCLLITGRGFADPADANWETACFGSGIQGGGVFVIAISGNDVYVGGSFTSAGGISGTSNIAKWNAITHTWSALGSGVNGTVWSIAVCGTDVYVGGEFTNPGGAVGASGIAKWDGHRWIALPSALGGFNLRVSAIAVSPDHMNVYAGGMFDRAGGQPAMNIARWDVQQQKWYPMGAGVGTSANNVTAIAVDDTGVYAGGNWRDVMGRPVVSKWDGSKWTPVGSGVGNDSTRGDIIMGITVHAQQIYTGIWGDVGRENIVVWNGNSWSQLDGGVGAGVFATRWAGSDLFVGGNFSTAGNGTAKYIAKWDGQGWQPLGSGANGLVRAFAKKDGDFYVVGDFTQVGGKSANNIAIWHAPVSIVTGASPTTGGTTSGDGTFPYGTVVTVHAAANAGCDFINWTEDGQSVGGSVKYAFPANASRILVANFKLKHFTITTSSVPTAGGTTSGGGAYPEGTMGTLHAAANAGYDFVNWTEGGRSVGGSVDYPLAARANRKLVANFKIKHFAITTSSLPTTGGKTSGDGTFPFGTTVTLLAKANAGYDFVNWTAAGQPVGGSADFAFPATSNLNLVANFKVKQITIATSSLPTIGGKTSGGGTFPFGTTGTVHAAANVGYDFVNWTEGDQSVSGSTDFAFPAATNRNLVANFKLKQFVIATSTVPTAGGAASGGGTYPSETAVTLHAAANVGYDFVNWTEGGQSVGGSVDYAFFVTTNRILVANYKIKQFTIKTSSVPTAGGAASGGGTYPYGMAVTLHAKANAGYDFINWTEGGQSVGGSADYAFPVTANRNLVASFKVKQFTINTSSVPTAGGTASGGGIFSYGTTVSVHAAANAGYDFVNWTEGGQSVGGSADYAFPAATNRNLVANFKLKQIAIATSSLPTAGGTASGGGIFSYGTTVAVHATAIAGYDFVNWMEGGQSVGGSVDYAFFATTNRNLVANFKLKQIAIATSSLPTAGGTASGGGIFSYGMTDTVHAKANVGYDFVNWTEGGQTVGGSADYALTATTNRNLVANFKLKQITIAISSAPAAGGATSGGGTFAYGMTDTVHAKADVGYDFVNWTEGGQTVGGSADYALTATTNRNLVANFKIKQFAIATSSVPTAGGTSSGAGSYPFGTKGSLHAAANAGYDFVNWTDGGQSVGGSADYALTATTNRNLVANFKIKQIVITTSSLPTAGGTSSGAGSYPFGTKGSLHAAANAGYDFVNWTDGGQSVSGTADYALTITTNRNLVATFKIKQFVITTSSLPTDGGATSGGGTSAYGTTVTVHAKANAGYDFANWSEGDQSVGGSADYAFLAAANRTLVANFKIKRFTIMTSNVPVAGGTASGGGTFAYGTTVTVHAAVNVGYDFVNWTEGGQTVGGSADYALTATTNRNLVANFKLKQFAIATSSLPTASGATSGAGIYPFGTKVSLHATVNGGYDFVNWTEGGQTVGGSADYALTATTNRNLVANFKLKQFAIAASSDPVTGGTTSGSGTYPYGKTVTVHAKANADYDFGNWTEGDQSVAGTVDYMFLAVTNRNLVANFKIKQFAIATSSAPTTGGTTSGAGTYPFGTKVALHAAANAGYDFVNWTDGSQSVGESAYYAFPAVTTRNLVANFKLKQFAIATSSAPATGGTTSGSGMYPYGTPVTVHAKAKAGYDFVNWTEGGQSVSGTADYAFPAAANRNLIANFKLKQFTIKTSSLPTAGGATSGGGTFACGTTVNLQAVANSGYDFLNWTEGGQSVSGTADYAFPAAANRNLIANFKLKQFTIATSSAPTAGGTTSGDEIYPSGTTVSLHAVVNTGYDFVHWTENGQSVSGTADYVFPVTTNRNLVANFKLKQFTIATSSAPTAGGMTSGDGIYPTGTTVTVQAYPKPDFLFVDWKVGGQTVSTSPGCQFKAAKNLDLVANFKSHWQAVEGPDGPVSAIAISRATNIIVAGSFSYVGESLPANNIANWRVSGGWQAVGGGASAPVSALAVNETNVYVGGKFASVGNGVTASRIAAYDVNKNQWMTLGNLPIGQNAYVNAIGVLGRCVYAARANPFVLFDPILDLWKGENLKWLHPFKLDGPIYAMGAGPGNQSDLFIGGAFTKVDGTAADGIAYWNGSSWHACGAGVKGTVHAIVASGSNVFVGGNFKSAGGQPISYVARWNGTGWSSLGQGVDGVVNAIAVDGAKVYVGGSFTHAGGKPVPVQGVAVYDAAHDDWSSLGSGVDGQVNAIVVDSFSNVYIGGQFNQPSKNFAIWQW